MGKIKIGVVTFWISKNNYGQILQGYALQKYLEKNNCEASIIRFNSVVSQIKDSITELLSGNFVFNCISNRKRNFNSFKRKIKYSPKIYYMYSLLKKENFDFSLLIVGSDQVWTYMRNEERRNTYLLNFSEKIEKISYAASFGRNSLKKDEVDFYINSLKHFKSISVRESKGVEICNQLGFHNAIQVVDPVALIDISIWRGLKSNIVLPKNGKQNIFVYSLTKEDNNSKLKELILALNNKYNLFYTNSSEAKSTANCYPTIEEWIGYIDNCDFVITDSFHCTLMAIILKKRFVTFLRIGGLSMNDRLLTLLKVNDFQQRYISLEKIKTIIDFIEDKRQIDISLNFKKQIDDSKLYLNEIISTINKDQ